MPKKVIGRKRTGKYLKHRRKLVKKGTQVCWLCGRPCGAEGFEADHVIPHSKGGSGHRVNIRPSHGICNRSRNSTGRSPVFLNSTPTLNDFLSGRIVVIEAAEKVVLDPRMWTDWWHHPEYLKQQAEKKRRKSSSKVKKND
jgi:hypothetical protein